VSHKILVTVSRLPVEPTLRMAAECVTSMYRKEWHPVGKESLFTINGIASNFVIFEWQNFLWSYIVLLFASFIWCFLTFSFSAYRIPLLHNDRL